MFVFLPLRLDQCSSVVSFHLFTFETRYVSVFLPQRLGVIVDCAEHWQICESYQPISGLNWLMFLQSSKTGFY